MLSLGYGSEDLSSEDIKNMFNSDVCECLNILYIEVIKLLANGTSYEEIYDFIDNYDLSDKESLLEDQKGFVKSKVKKDLNKRKLNIKER